MCCLEQKKIKVQLGMHAKDRWHERAGRSHGQLVKLITFLLREKLGSGLIIDNNRAMLPLDAERFGLRVGLVACIELPDTNGVWRVVTFTYMNGKQL